MPNFISESDSIHHENLIRFTSYRLMCFNFGQLSTIQYVTILKCSIVRLIELFSETEGI